MKAQDLKNSILQYAMQGKLVPQDPEDEPVSLLLERIKEEKEKLIKEKVIKSEKTLPPITEDEIPFQIPNEWEWLRLGDIGTWGAGSTPSRTNPSYYGGNIPWLKTGELTDDLITEAEEYITELALEKTSVKLNPVGSVLIAMYGATIGKLGILTFEATTNQACCACVPYTSVYNKYLFYYLMSERKTFIESAEGGAQPNISRTKIVNFRFPLPPLAEQKRIVEKIEDLFEKVDQYDVLEQEITALNNSFPKDMEKSILKFAMQGKLVEQDTNDEPASELLERITEERERLIKEKVIKREKLTPLTEDEIPYEIPSTWSWVKLGEIITLISGRDLATSEYNDKNEGIPYLTGASNFVDNQLLINRWTPTPKIISKKGDLLITCKGTIGDIIIQDIEEAHIARQIMAIRLFYEVDIYFLKYLLIRTVSELKANAKSMIPGISRDDILNIKTPLPPLAEQKRIVKKIEEMLKLTNKLKNRINQL